MWQKLDTEANVPCEGTVTKCEGLKNYIMEIVRLYLNNNSIRLAFSVSVRHNLLCRVAFLDRSRHTHEHKTLYKSRESIIFNTFCTLIESQRTRVRQHLGDHKQRQGASIFSPGVHYTLRQFYRDVYSGAPPVERSGWRDQWLTRRRPLVDISARSKGDCICVVEWESVAFELGATPIRQ